MPIKSQLHGSPDLKCPCMNRGLYRESSLDQSTEHALCLMLIDYYGTDSIAVPQLPLSDLEKTQGVLTTSGLRIDS